MSGLIGQIGARSGIVDDPIFPAGHILNVFSNTKTDTSSSSTSSWAEITDLTNTISNPNNGSNFLLTGHVSGAWASGVAKIGIKLTRTDSSGESDIAIGDAAGDRTRAHGALYLATENQTPFPMVISFYDTSASTSSSITYKVYFNNADNGGAVYINRGYTDGDVSSITRTVSTFTVIEVAG